MNLETLRRCCLRLPHATEHVQWGDHLVFKVAGKIFAIASVDPSAAHKVSLKADPETFAQLTEQPGVVPAPYLARAGWIALERFSALADREIEALLAESHRLVVERLPKKTQRDLESRARSAPRARRTPRR
jgi:predicted DNA-binding protein (MmcQ/YjbR family)